jgi:hypothetical protein
MEVGRVVYVADMTGRAIVAGLSVLKRRAQVVLTSPPIDRQGPGKIADILEIDSRNAALSGNLSLLDYDQKPALSCRCT